MATLRPVFVVIGVGTGSGTGGAAARLFAKSGYSVAILSRGKEKTQKLADEITSAGGEAKAFPIDSYSTEDIVSAFASLDSTFPSSAYSLRVALFNAAQFIYKPFLETALADIQASLEINFVAGFTFSQQVIQRFKANEIADGKRGTLIFTGATASVRGAANFSAFASAKNAVRAMSQSLAKEFGKVNIHVSHAIIDGGIKTEIQRSRNSAEWAANEDVGLDPNAIASVYLHLVNQHRSCWTWELDLRPAHEKW